MPVNYTLIAVPLDTRDPAANLRTFTMAVVAEPRFSEGEHQPAEIRDAVMEHPLLSGRSRSLKAVAVDSVTWTLEGHSFRRPLVLELTYSGDIPQADLLLRLNTYLGGSSERRTAGRVDHDARHDQLADDHFVDVAEAYDELRAATRRMRFAVRGAALSANATTEASPDSLSIEFSKWINGAVQASVLEAIASGASSRRAAILEFAPSLERVAAAVNKIQRRLAVDDRPRFASDEIGLRSVQATTTRDVDIADLNVAVQSAIKNELLARSCGFVTLWTVRADADLPLNTAIVIKIDRDSLTFDATKIDVATPATEFVRDSHTHPASFAARLPGGAMAALNGPGQRIRYRAVSVNSEREIVKHVVLQTANSLGGPANERPEQFGNFEGSLDDRPPQLMRSDQYGLAEPETSGVVFSAPVEDLITPPQLRETPAERAAEHPCLYLEDLWTGYRLDVRKVGARDYRSTHRHNARITLRSDGSTLAGPTEDYIEREQTDDPKLGSSSTELTLYKGMSAGQASDYLNLLGIARARINDPMQPFQVTIDGYDSVERLLFGESYDYRLRNVFIGGISASVDDPELSAARFGDVFHQTFPFYRARSLRPGELLTPPSTAPSEPSTPQESDAAGKTIVLTEQSPSASIVLVPSPIDLDGSRFHGLLFADASEMRRHKERCHVSDLTKFFPKLPPRELNYFYDPDVHGVIVRVVMLNGDDNARTEQFTYIDGTYCRVSRHLTLDPVRQTYGQPKKWESFRPIVISLRTTSGSLPVVRRRGQHRVEIFAPPAGELRISILPLVEQGLASKTASLVASSAELKVDRLLTASDAFAVPSIAEQTIKVIHAIREPRRPPQLFCARPKITPEIEHPLDSPAIGIRDLDSEQAGVLGHVEVDAASTKEVRLEATWDEISDDTNQNTHVLESGTATTKPRSVVFRKYEPAAPSAKTFLSILNVRSSISSTAVHEHELPGFTFNDQFRLQCAEDRVFLGIGPNGQPASGPDQGNRFDLKNARRKMLKVEAVASSRFASRFGGPAAETERRSEPTLVDVPSSVRMAGPKVSHVLPLGRVQLVGNNQDGRTITSYGLRVYLHRPWFESGFGERLAIGCLVGDEVVTQGAQEVPKHITQWGEDPIERGFLQSTRRMPTAADFASCHDRLADSSSRELYPEHTVDGNSPVIYRDNVRLAGTEPNTVPRRLSIASFALQFDAHQQLWYCDVYVKGDFFGWCGMSLYRHQPHAVEGRELSDTWDWVYAAVIYGEPVAWVERGDNLRVTIGPIFDTSLSFELDSLVYRDGISGSPDDASRVVTPMQSYRVNNANYFEGVVERHAEWSVLKKRFGHNVASRRVRPRL